MQPFLRSFPHTSNRRESTYHRVRRAATAANAPPINPIAIKEPRIAIGPPKIEARKNHLEHGWNSLRVLPISPYLPSTPFQRMSASITVSALKAVISTAVTTRDTPSPLTLA